ncbi:hypothetical protein ACTUVK_002168 [Stenotrophomonas rhizophila]
MNVYGSLAGPLISEDGMHRFYREVYPLPETPTDFVREVVYPLLDHGGAARQPIALTRDLRSFLSCAEAPIVLADFPNDLALLRHALRGFGLPDEQALSCGPTPDVVMTVMLKDGVTWKLIDAYFDAYPEARLRRHHALVDAEALRMAWLIAARRIGCPFWAKDVMRCMG